MLRPYIMKKLNLYEIDVIHLPSEKHLLFIAANNLDEAFKKAQARLWQSPHNIPFFKWKLTGKYKILGKVFI